MVAPDDLALLNILRTAKRVRVRCDRTENRDTLATDDALALLLIMVGEGADCV